MRHDPDPSALQTASIAAARLGEALGANLVAVYLHGSAVLGGYDPAASDLDLLVISRDPLSEAQMDAAVEAMGRIELPAKGLELSVLTTTEAISPDLHRPHFQLHLAVDGARKVRRVDGRARSGDRDLILHLAVARASGHALVGPAPEMVLAAIPDDVVGQATVDEIAWARDNGDPVYLVLTAARAQVFARTGRLVSKVEAGEAEADRPVVRAALALQLGGVAVVTIEQARGYADDVEASLRGDPAR